MLCTLLNPASGLTAGAQLAAGATAVLEIQPGDDLSVSRLLLDATVGAASVRVIGITIERVPLIPDSYGSYLAGDPVPEVAIPLWQDVFRHARYVRPFPLRTGETLAVTVRNDGGATTTARLALDATALDPEVQAIVPPWMLAVGADIPANANAYLVGLPDQSVPRRIHRMLPTAPADALISLRVGNAYVFRLETPAMLGMRCEAFDLAEVVDIPTNGRATFEITSAAGGRFEVLGDVTYPVRLAYGAPTTMREPHKPRAERLQTASDAPPVRHREVSYSQSQDPPPTSPAPSREVDWKQQNEGPARLN